LKVTKHFRFSFTIFPREIAFPPAPEPEEHSRLYFIIKRPSFSFAGEALREKLEAELLSRFGPPHNHAQWHLESLSFADTKIQRQKVRRTSPDAARHPVSGHVILTNAEEANALLKLHHIVSS
jgi:hypothetical protein